MFFFRQRQGSFLECVLFFNIFLGGLWWFLVFPTARRKTKFVEKNKIPFGFNFLVGEAKAQKKC